MENLNKINIGDLVKLEYEWRKKKVSNIVGFVHEVDTGYIRLSNCDPSCYVPPSWTLRAKYGQYSINRIKNYEVLQESNLKR